MLNLVCCEINLEFVFLVSEVRDIVVDYFFYIKFCFVVWFDFWGMFNEYVNYIVLEFIMVFFMFVVEFCVVKDFDIFFGCFGVKFWLN